jgi:hypothetical protein
MSEACIVTLREDSWWVVFFFFLAQHQLWHLKDCQGRKGHGFCALRVPTHRFS